MGVFNLYARGRYSCDQCRFDKTYVLVRCEYQRAPRYVKCTSIPLVATLSLACAYTQYMTHVYSIPYVMYMYNLLVHCESTLEIWLITHTTSHQNIRSHIIQCQGQYHKSVLSSQLHTTTQRHCLVFWYNVQYVTGAIYIYSYIWRHHGIPLGITNEM